jgi:hypothetical protein
LTNLPTEILHIIISTLDRVSSTCFGLASYRLYLVHFSVNGKVGWGENTVYTIEVEDGIWANGANTGFNIWGPMTVVRSSSLGDMLMGKEGGREWDWRLKYFRRMKGVTDTTVENAVDTTMEEVKDRTVERVEHRIRNEIVECQSQSDGDVSSHGHETAPEWQETETEIESVGAEAEAQGTDADEADSGKDDKKRKLERTNWVEAKKAKLDIETWDREDVYNRETIGFIEAAILMIDGRGVEDVRKAAARKMLIAAGSILSAHEAPGEDALVRAGGLMARTAFDLGWKFALS